MAVGPDSLATATAVPFMSTFVTCPGLSPMASGKHLGSSVGSYVVGDISRKGRFHRRDQWTVCGDAVSLYATWDELAGSLCEETRLYPGRRHNSISEALLGFDRRTAFEWKEPFDRMHLVRASEVRQMAEHLTFDDR